jgi:hypothetical protein
VPPPPKNYTEFNRYLAKPIGRTILEELIICAKAEQ